MLTLCTECHHSKDQHSEADEPVSVGQCATCYTNGSLDDAWHDYTAAVPVTDTTPTVIHRTPEQLRTQRTQLVASTGLTEDVLTQRGETFQLYPEHQNVWETIKGIDYLLTGETGR